MNIWLDDQRPAPEGWVHLHNFKEVKLFMENAKEQSGFVINKMSFDYHLSGPKKGVDVMRYLAKLCQRNQTDKFWPKEIFYHSNDPEGVKIMKEFVKKFDKKVLNY